MLIINLDELRKVASSEEMIKLALSNRWRCHDQDVLNMVCKNRVYYIPQQWNVLMSWQEPGLSLIHICAPIGARFQQAKVPNPPNSGKNIAEGKDVHREVEAGYGKYTNLWANVCFQIHSSYIRVRMPNNVCDNPVSYTHLDVYKRQDEG